MNVVQPLSLTGWISAAIQTSATPYFVSFATPFLYYLPHHFEKLKYAYIVVAYMVADMKVDMVADMEVDMVADMGVDKVADKVADMVAEIFWQI